MWNNNINPYTMYYQSIPKRLPENKFAKINFQGFLDNTQKTLGVINQAIPIYNQVKPMFKNLGTMFRIVNSINTPSVNEAFIKSASSSTNPVFFT